MQNLYKKESTSLLGYQKTGVLTMLKNRALVLGDATGLGKTLQVICAFTYMKSKYPEYKMIVLTDKSVVFQFEKEVHKFMDGIKTLTIYEEEKESRLSKYDKFLSEADILITNYASFRSDFLLPEYQKCWLSSDIKKSILPEESYKKGNKVLKGVFGTLEINKKGNVIYKADISKVQSSAVNPCHDSFSFKDSDGVPHIYVADINKHEFHLDVQLTHTVEGKTCKSFVYQTSPLRGQLSNNIKSGSFKLFMAFDEAEAFSDTDSLTYKMAHALSKMSERVVAMTATVSKGAFIEAFNIFKCIGIKLFSDAEFKEKFMVMEPNYKLPRVKWGPRKGKPQLEHVGYKNIALFEERIRPFYLGRSKKDVTDIPPFTHERYYPKECSGIHQALTLLYNESIKTKTPVNVGRLRIAHVTPQLIDTSLPRDYISSPVQDFIHACHHYFTGQKLVVYLDYKTPVDLLEEILPQHLPDKYKNILKITGDVGDRESVRSLFTESPDHNLLFLNSAGRRGLNLQVSGDLWFMIDPFTGGDYAQVGGRVSRLGTLNEKLTIHKSIILDSVMEDVQKIIQSDLRIMKRIAPNSVDEGLIEPEYDSLIEIPDFEEFMLESFKNRSKRYVKIEWDD